MQDSPLYIFCQSYGAKFAVALAERVAQVSLNYYTI